MAKQYLLYTKETRSYLSEAFNMRAYFKLQCKRVSKVFVSILLVTLVLAVGIGTILLTFIGNYINSDENTVFKVGITGDTENEYLKWGIAAVQAFDDTRFTIEFVNMEEEEAVENLSNGTLTAYIDLPTGFIEGVMTGDLIPIRFVTTPGASGLVTMFKNEITGAIVEMAIDTQRGTNGIYNVAFDQGIGKEAGDLQYKLSLSYIDLIISRGDMISVDILGISSGLSMVEYYICGFSLVLLMLAGLPFVTIYCRRDGSLNALLFSKEFSYKKQVLCELCAHFLSLLCLALLTVLSLSALLIVSPDLISFKEILSFLLYLIPVVLMLASLNLMLFELTSNIVSGVLLHFFMTLSLCYVSGCFYPVFAFPEIIQKIQFILPTAISRSCLANAFSKEPRTSALFATLLFALAFYLLTVYIRARKMQQNKEAKK